MKILFLSDKFPPKISGGASTAAFNLAKALRKKGHQVFVITTVQKKSEEKRFNLGGLDIFQVYINYHERWKAWLGIYNSKIVSKIEKIIKEIKPDVIHAHNIHQYLSYHSLKISKKHAKKVFLTAHDVMLIHYGKLIPKKKDFIHKIGFIEQIKEAKKRYNPFRNIFIRHYLKYVDKIFAVSNSLKKILEINRIKNVKTIHNAIDLNEWKVDKEKIERFRKKYDLIGKKALIFTARLIEAKGGDQLIKSLNLVNKEFSNFILLIIGKEWKYTDKLKKIAKSLNIADKIIFTGELGLEDLKIAYNSIDISIFPSLCFESFGMANLEAMACKKPVISSFFGGSEEVVVDTQTGYLIDPNNINIMAEKIVDLLKNPQKAEDFGKAGYKRAKRKFSIERLLRDILLQY